MVFKKLKYFIGSVGFATKAEAKPYVRERLRDKGYGAVYETDGVFHLIHDVLKLHERYNEKVGSGIDYFMIEPNALTKRDYTIVVHRTDGTSEDMGWSRCVDFRPRSPNNLLGEAMREAISHHILEYKKSQKLICKECGEQNLEAQDFHVDHNTIRFRELKADFLNSTSLSIPEEFSKNNLNMEKFRLEDKEFCNSWIQYHNSRADYQILCRKCNSHKH